MRIVKAPLLAALMVLCIATATEAQSYPPTYKDKTVQFVVGFTTGTGFDLQSRLIARHLGDYLPGKPAMVVQNMPGAGSIKAGDYLYFTAPKIGRAHV